MKHSAFEFKYSHSFFIWCDYFKNISFSFVSRLFRTRSPFSLTALNFHFNPSILFFWNLLRIVKTSEKCEDSKDIPPSQNIWIRTLRLWISSPWILNVCECDGIPSNIVCYICIEIISKQIIAHNNCDQHMFLLQMERNLKNILRNVSFRRFSFIRRNQNSRFIHDFLASLLNFLTTSIHI